MEPYDLIFASYRDQQDKFVDSDGDSDDSNEENHFGNEYPDSDEGDGERAMRHAIDNMGLDGEESSDDEDYYEGASSKPSEAYVHTLEVDEPGFMGDVDFQDTADRYGIAYARYKKKILKAFANAKEVPTDEEEDDEERSSGNLSDREWRRSDDEDCYSENELDKFAWSSSTSDLTVSKHKVVPWSYKIFESLF